MPVRYHDNDRRLVLGVHDVVGAGPPRGDLRAGVPMAGAVRLKAGQEAHTQWQSWRSENDEAFEAEVFIKVTLVVRGWECTIRGRIDGLTVENGRTVVEELKSSALDGQTLHGTMAHDWPAYFAQVALYRLLLHLSGKNEPLARLVLVSLVDGARHVMVVDEPLPETREWLEAQLGHLVHVREQHLAWMRKRRSSTVPFAHPDFRPGQEAIARDVEEAIDEGRQLLLTAPTGTGKTAAVLHGVLTAAYRKNLRVFIATAKGTQQAIAERTLGLLDEQDLPLRAVSIRAKEKACLNDVVDCRPESCRYAETYFDRLLPGLKELSEEGAASPRVVQVAGRAHGLCPFELSLDYSEVCDVIVGDYNYAFNPRVYLRRHFGDRYKDWVIVVDEAHNLVERARGQWSPELKAVQASAAVEQLDEEGARFEPFRALAAEVEGHVRDQQWSARESPVQRGREAVIDLSWRIWKDLGERFAELGLDYAMLRRERPVESDDHYLQLSRDVAQFVSVLEEWRANGKGQELVSIYREDPHPAVKLVCLDPSVWMKRRLAGFGAVVLMSATLKPARFHQDLLGLDEERVRISEHPSPFPPENLSVMVAPRISTAWRDRQRDKERTAQLIEQVIHATPGNVAVFYSAFSMLEQLLPLIDHRGRTVLEQQRRMDEDERQALVDGLRLIGPHKVLHGVLGGIFSEGIDLPGGLLKAAVLVGPALPRVGLERQLMQDWYDHQYENGFAYAFLAPGMARVVQAAGRVVRSAQDRGVVVLAGRRFRYREYQGFFPESWSPSMPDDVAVAVEDFWAQVESAK